MSKDLNPEKARIFRITHISNLKWILENGLHSSSSNTSDPNFVAIGHPDLIDKRSRRTLPQPFGGVLSDYVPFYFTPFSPMMLNIKTGRGGVTKRSNEEIVILVSSIHKLESLKTSYAFSDRHAYLQAAQFYNSSEHLGKIDWELLQRRDFKRDPNDPEKFERYEAEALGRVDKMSDPQSC